MQIKQHILLMSPSPPAQYPSAFSWRQLDSAKFLTITLVSETMFQKWKEDHNSLKSEGRRDCYKGTRRQKPKFLHGVEGWKEEEMTCQNHSARHKVNLGEEDPGSAKHRDLAIFSKKAPLLNICKSLKWYNMSHAEVLCRDKYKLRKKELVAMTQKSQICFWVFLVNFTISIRLCITELTRTNNHNIAHYLQYHCTCQLKKGYAIVS